MHSVKKMTDGELMCCYNKLWYSVPIGSIEQVKAARFYTTCKCSKMFLCSVIKTLRCCQHCREPFCHPKEKKAVIYSSQGNKEARKSVSFFICSNQLTASALLKTRCDVVEARSGLKHLGTYFSPNHKLDASRHFLAKFLRTISKIYTSQTVLEATVLL